MRTLLLLVSALLLVSVASASDSLSLRCELLQDTKHLLCQPDDGVETPPAHLDTSGVKSPRRALLLSGLGTLAIGVPGVNLVAIPVGPALGHFYAGNARQAWTGILIRGGAFFGGVAVVVLKALEGDPNFDEDAERILTGALIVILASAAYDVATAPASARRFNERQQQRVQMSLSPVVGRQKGVRLAVRL